MPPASVAQVMSSPRRKRASLPEVAELRQDPRYECQLAVQVRELTPTTDLFIAMLGGVVTDMSQSGVRIRTVRPLTTFATVRCEITFPNTSLSVPTLMQVRWTRQTGDCQYDCGLVYLV